MVELDRLRAIADDLSKSEWCMGLSAALHKTLEDIARETEDISGYESDVLGWVEKNGGLDAVKERTMPEGMEWLLDVWPKWSNGEYCKFGDWWVSDNYGVSKPKRFRRLSIYTPEQLDEWGQGDGESYDYEWDFLRPADPKYRPDKVEPPEPKVLDADGVEIRVGDEVWPKYPSADRSEQVERAEVVGIQAKHGRVDVQAVYPTGLSFREQVDADWLTHRKPVLAADGKPLEVGQTVWHRGGNACGVVESIDAGSLMHTVRYRSDGGEEYRDAAKDLTHQRPVLDADGAPIKVGDTVYDKDTGDRFEVDGFSYDGVVCTDIDACESDIEILPSQLTHAKTEPPDSFSLIEQDAELTPYDYAMKYGKPDGVSNGKFQRVDLVRRARALA